MAVLDRRLQVADDVVHPASNEFLKHSKGLYNPGQTKGQHDGRSVEPKRGAGNETRTRDPDLGKVVLYQLSYSRMGPRILRTAARLSTWGGDQGTGNGERKSAESAGRIRTRNGARAEDSELREQASESRNRLLFRSPFPVPCSPPHFCSRKIGQAART